MPAASRWRRLCRDHREARHFPAHLSRLIWLQRNGTIAPMRIGIAHHLGWAVAVTASPEFEVLDRRRLELIEEGLPAAPIHHEGGTHEMHSTGVRLEDDELATLVARVRESVTEMTASSLDEVVATVNSPITSLAIRRWPPDFPTDIATLRRPPYESRADSVMYCEVIAAVAERRGWQVSTYDAKTVEAEAASFLGSRADDVLRQPRRTLGPPWTKDHRMALAGAIVSAQG